MTRIEELDWAYILLGNYTSGNIAFNIYVSQSTLCNRDHMNNGIIIVKCEIVT